MHLQPVEELQKKCDGISGIPADNFAPLLCGYCPLCSDFEQKRRICIRNATDGAKTWGKARSATEYLNDHKTSRA